LKLSARTAPCAAPPHESTTMIRSSHLDSVHRSSDRAFSDYSFPTPPPFSSAPDQP
jgi:hypothetical protein